MAEYQYSRKFLSDKGFWDTDCLIESQSLARKIKNSFNQGCVINCDGPSCSIIFETSLSQEQKLQLDTIVATFKAMAAKNIVSLSSPKEEILQEVLAIEQDGSRMLQITGDILRLLIFNRIRSIILT